MTGCLQVFLLRINYQPRNLERLRRNHPLACISGPFFFFFFFFFLRYDSVPIPLLPLPDTQNMHFPKWPPNTISKISHLRSMSQVMNTWQIQLYLAQVTDYKCEKARFCVCIFREMPPNLTFLKQLAYCNVLRKRQPVQERSPYRNLLNLVPGTDI